MTTKDEALQMALDALETCAVLPLVAGPVFEMTGKAIIACREALAQKDEQEPIGEAHSYESTTRYTHCIWDAKVVSVGTKLYTAPPKRQPLTDEEIRAIWVNYTPIVGGVIEFARAIEAAHGIGAEHEPR